MRGYEAIFILRPSLNEEERMQHVEKIEKIISTNGVLHESNYWGRKRFAYPIQKFGDGHFYFFVFDAESTIPYDLKRLTKVTETILRSLIIVRDTTYHPKEDLSQTNKELPPTQAISIPEKEIEVKEEPEVKEEIEVKEETMPIEEVSDQVDPLEEVNEVKNEDMNAE
jgi:small subunit ribosomal protein S6